MHVPSGWSRVVVAVASATVLAAGCGPKEPSQPAEPAAAVSPAPAAANAPVVQPAATTAPAQPVPEPAATPTEAPVTPAAPAVPPAAQAPASAFVQDHETGVEVTLVDVRRTGGDSVTVKWRYRNTQPAEVKIAKGGSSWVDPYRLTMEAFLVDPVNKKKYLVITDAEKIPLTSRHGDWQGVTLASGQTLSAWAKFPAPPADVEKITVTIPGVAPFEDVPIVK